MVGGRTLTARQAALANVVDPTHVSLSESQVQAFCLPLSPNTSLGQPASGRKKKPLTDLEIALKREETARKRRNLTEKKLEDEKVGILHIFTATSASYLLHPRPRL